MKLSHIKIILRDFIYDFNDKFSNLGKPLFAMWNVFHKIKFATKKIIKEGRGNLIYESDKLSAAKVLWINPQKIEFYLTNKVVQSSEFSKELKGDWDLTKKLIKDSIFYRVLNSRFLDEEKKEEIKKFNLILQKDSNRIENGGFNNKDEWEDKLREIESKYYQIKNNLDDFIESNRIKKKQILEKWESFERIVVAIDRDGQFLVVEGINNLLIGKFLAIPKIPVYVSIRHEAWADFKKKIYFFSTNYRKRRLYQRVTHPDLQDIPFTYGDERFKVIKENLSIFHGTLLDIGANLGYFCREFEDEGFDCYAVEVNKLYTYFLTKLKKAENRKYKIINKSIFNYKKNQELRFDITLALYIFHHFLKRKNIYLNLINLLKRLKTKELYFGTHNPDEFRGIKVYRNYNPEQFVNFVLENSCLNKAELLIKMNNGRNIYKLTVED